MNAQRPTQHGWRFAVLSVSCAVLAGCGAGRSASSPTELYACSGPADCLVGSACICHFCQNPAAPRWTCAGDTASEDLIVAQDSVAADIHDVPKAETASGDCDLSTWSICGTGDGCYYTPATGTKTCQAYGKLGEGATCDPAQPQGCGRSAVDARPLICDAVDKKCYRTCVCTKLAELPCPAKMTCYCLKDGADPWPDGAGICAP